MTNKELTQIVTAHQSAIAGIETLLANYVQANEAARERFDAEIINLALLISAQAESAQRVEDSVQRLADILSERFRSNGH